MPLFKGQELLGYLGVENFEADRLAYAKDLLAQYTQYLSSKLATIQRMSELAAGNYRVSVASSDGLVQLSALGSGVLRVSARELEAEVNRAKEEMKRFY